MHRCAVYGEMDCKRMKERKIDMKKKVLANLEKCYSIAPLHYKGAEHILVAAEKTDRCILFVIDGNEEETVWEGPEELDDGSGSRAQTGQLSGDTQVLFTE